MRQALRRLAGRIARRLFFRTIGGGKIPHLVVHAVLPPLEARGVARSLHRSRGGLAWARTGHLLHPGGDEEDLATAVHKLKVRRPLRAVIISSDGALGPGAVAPAELVRLRPGASDAIPALVAALPAGQVTVVLDLPTPAALVGEVATRAVAAGERLMADMHPVPSLYQDLADRIAAVPGVDQVVRLADDGGSDRLRAGRVIAAAGVDVIPAGAGRSKRGSSWTLRSLLAADAVNPALDRGERSLVHGELRAMMAGKPFRPPEALMPCEERRSLEVAAHVAGCGTLGIRELHLHAGIQKTATTTVQAAMTAARDTLRLAGVTYVDRADMMRLRDLRAWGAYRATGTASFAGFARELQAVVRRQQRLTEQETLPTDVVFISNETLVGVIERGPFFERPFRRFAERALFEILDVLQPEQCHVSLVTRRQDNLIESQYMWQLHGGESFAFDRYLEAARRHPEALSYRDLAERIEGVIGVSSVRMQPYELIHVDLGRFLNGLLVPMGVSVDFGTLEFPRRANPAYSDRGMELARAINPHLDAKKEVVQVREFLREVFPVGEDSAPARLLDESQRLELIRSHADDNEATLRRWMPSYPEDLYSRLDTVEVLRGG